MLVFHIYFLLLVPNLFSHVSLSGVITSGDIADSLVMKKMDDNRGLMIIRDASHKHIQPLTLAYFRRDLIKIW